MKNYKKKPVVIQAVQHTDDNTEECGLISVAIFAATYDAEDE